MQQLVTETDKRRRLAKTAPPPGEWGCWRRCWAPSAAAAGCPRPAATPTPPAAGSRLQPAGAACQAPCTMPQTWVPRQASSSTGEMRRLTHGFVLTHDFLLHVSIVGRCCSRVLVPVRLSLRPAHNWSSCKATALANVAVGLSDLGAVHHCCKASSGQQVALLYTQTPELLQWCGVAAPQSRPGTSPGRRPRRRRRAAWSAACPAAARAAAAARGA